MERARHDIQHAPEGTYGFLANKVLRPTLERDFVDGEGLAEFQQCCVIQLSGDNDERAFDDATTELAHLKPTFVMSPYSASFRSNIDLAKVAVPGGKAYGDTDLYARYSFLLDCANEQVTRKRRVKEHGHTGSSSSSRRPTTPRTTTSSASRRTSNYELQRTLGPPRSGFRFPDRAFWLLKRTGVTVAHCNGVVEFESLPNKQFSAESPLYKFAEDNANPVGDLPPDEQGAQEIANDRATRIRAHFRVGMCQVLAFLCIGADMGCARLGMLINGPKFSRLVAVSPRVIAIEFLEEEQDYKWNHTAYMPRDVALPDPPRSAAGRPIANTPMSARVVPVSELLRRLTPWAYRLAHDFVAQTTDDGVVVDHTALQTYLDFYVAAAHPTAHVALGQLTAIDWDDTARLPLHSEILAAASTYNVDLDEAGFDAIPATASKDRPGHFVRGKKRKGGDSDGGGDGGSGRDWGGRGGGPSGRGRSGAGDADGAQDDGGGDTSATSQGQDASHTTQNTGQAAPTQATPSPSPPAPAHVPDISNSAPPLNCFWDINYIATLDDDELLDADMDITDYWAFYAQVPLLAEALAFVKVVLVSPGEMEGLIAEQICAR